ncbi:aspartate-semialdehyde dehydrogenase [Vibrio bivalvicida]|uniref:Aspartate-semialdehyde dehydrogenase n=1 Tax=Vibrio bivalvicida TaxID=1276888 RepID=A0ABV4MMF2_9VIBR
MTLAEVRNNALVVKQQVLSESVLDEFSGYDPFDGLNSRLFDVLPRLKKGLVGLAWIQLFKRSPINFRPLAGVPKKRNPKGIGLFILGMLEDYKRTKETKYLDLSVELGDWLLTQECDKQQWKHSCWGYHFDWKARAFYVPKGKPNVITTVYVSQALLELARTLDKQGLSGSERFKAPALDAANFIVNSLYTESDRRCFFAYIPGETAFVHNASLWAAAWVATVANETDNGHYKQLALKVARQSAQEQRSDGSWVYGARHHHQFIDGFHTGYNLEALDIVRRCLATVEFDEVIGKGLDYYRTHFFEQDGLARYYNDNPYPLDPHSVAQSIITFSKLSKSKSDAELIGKIIKWSVEHLYLPGKKQFVYQINKKSTNKINYMRWTQAWMYYSFSYYLNQDEH